jgi:hypothetical protein
VTSTPIPSQAKADALDSSPASVSQVDGLSPRQNAFSSGSNNTQASGDSSSASQSESPNVCFLYDEPLLASDPPFRTSLFTDARDRVISASRIIPSSQLLFQTVEEIIQLGMQVQKCLL